MVDPAEHPAQPRAAKARLALGQLRWPVLEAAAPLVLVPVGSLEQHGPHLPLGTDTMVAVAVTRAAADRLDATSGGQQLCVAPPVNYGASGEHQDFPGTVSIGHQALEMLLTELGRSACAWAAGVIFVNGHGGNAPTLVRSVRGLRDEGRSVAWTGCVAASGDAHAGATETSLLRHLAPWSVRLDLAEPGAVAPIEELMPRLQESGVRAVSPNGVLGDPTSSSSEHGRVVFEEMVRNLVAELGRIDVGDDGRLRRADADRPERSDRSGPERPVTDRAKTDPPQAGRPDRPKTSRR